MGQPNREDEKAYRTIASYCALRKRERHRPTRIFSHYGGLTDPRVTYWEPAKWVAKLRTRNTSDNLLIMKITMDRGHGGGPQAVRPVERGGRGLCLRVR